MRTLLISHNFLIISHNFLIIFFNFRVDLRKNHKNIDTLPSVLFTGLHHAREPLSYSMNLYLITYILAEVQRKNVDFARILDDCVVWFVPALNLDGYRKIQEDFAKFGKFNGNIRKNRRPLPQCSRFLLNFYCNFIEKY